MAELAGRVVASLESRRAAEFASLVQRHGGVSYPAPVLQELHPADPATLAAAVSVLCDAKTDAVLFLSGVGATDLVEAARALGRDADLHASLAGKLVAVRGPKPAAALRRYGLPFSLQAPEPHTTAELLAAVSTWELAGRTVAVQLAGDPNPVLRARLEERGATVVEVSPYRYGLPADTTPVVRLMDDLSAGRVDVLAATSGPQVANLFAIAEHANRVAELRDALSRLPVAAQGPVCAAAFDRVGVPVSILPEHGHMGALVLAIARYFTPIPAAPQSPVPAIGAV